MRGQVFFMDAFLYECVDEFFFCGSFLVQMRVCVVEFFFSCVFSWTSSFFRGSFLGRVRVCVDECVFSWPSSFFRGRLRVYFFSLSFFLL